MAHYETINIDRSEGWKYKSVFSDDTARILINDDGSINEESSYSRAYRELLHPQQFQKPIKQKKYKEKSGDGCIMKIIKAPFRLLWWIIKQVLIIVSFGILADWLNDKK